MIPKVINYCWFGGKPLPSDVKKCIKSWKKYCPDYAIKQWDESNFNVNHHPFTKAAYDAKAWAFVSDYARLKIIYDNGGIYLDTDVELIKTLDSFLKYECYLPIQQNGCYIATGLGFGAEKGNQVIGALVKSYNDLSFNNDSRGLISCPIVNTKVVKELGYQQKDELQQIDHAVIFPSEYFDPYPSGKGTDKMTNNTVSIHHYSASWTTGQQRFKRKIAMLIGEKNILKLKENISALNKRGGTKTSNTYDESIWGELCQSLR